MVLCVQSGAACPLLVGLGLPTLLLSSLAILGLAVLPVALCAPVLPGLCGQCRLSKLDSLLWAQPTEAQSQMKVRTGVTIAQQGRITHNKVRALA